jgi:hypothetical protein
MANWFKQTLGKALKVTLPTLTPHPGNLKPQEIQRREQFYWQEFLFSQPISYIQINHRIQKFLASSEYLRMFMALKLALYHWGFEIRAKERKDQAKLDEWFDTDVRPTKSLLDLEDMGTRELIEVEASDTNRERCYKFARDAFQKFIEYDSSVSIWIDGRDYALLRPLEYFLYSDIMGIETMKYLHGLSVPQIELLPVDQQQRFISHPLVFLNPKYGEHWKLAKRTPQGEGFGVPWMFAAFLTLDEEENKRLGFHGLSWLMRTVVQWHKIGHEVKNGPLAGRPKFEWTEEADKAVMKAFKDVTGVNTMTANYDAEIQYPWPEMEKFDKLCWEGSHFRLTRFFGPIAKMMYAEKAAPYLAGQLKALAVFDRQELMKPYFEYVLRKAYKPPVPIEVSWKEDIFNPDQLTHELRKFTAQQGLISPQTMSKWTGVNHDDEAEAKVKALKDDNAQERLLPIFDPSHGSSPAIDGPADPNKPTGTAGGGSPKKPPGKNGKPKGGKDKK